MASLVGSVKNSQQLQGGSGTGVVVVALVDVVEVVLEVVDEVEVVLEVVDEVEVVLVVVDEVVALNNI